MGCGGAQAPVIGTGTAEPVQHPPELAAWVWLGQLGLAGLGRLGLAGLGHCAELPGLHGWGPGQVQADPLFDVHGTL